MLRRSLVRCLGLSLAAVGASAGPVAARKDRGDRGRDETDSIAIRSASWDARSGTVRIAIDWLDEEWSAPNENALSLVIMARTGDLWSRLDARSIGHAPGARESRHAIRLRGEGLEAARNADQLLVAATRRHGDAPGEFEIAWYAGQTIAGQPAPAGGDATGRGLVLPCNAIYHGAVVEECSFSGIDLAAVDLRAGDLNDTHLEGASFRRARLAKAFITRAHLSGADLRSADLRRVVLVRSHMAGADLRRANLSHADLTEVNLSRSRLTRARLCRALVTNAHLAGANLADADLTGADFSFTDLTAATLLGARIDQATTFFGATFCGTVMPDGSVNNEHC